MIDFTKKQALTVKEFCQCTGMGRSTFYKLVDAERVVVHKLGRKNVVLMDDVKAFLDNLPLR